MSIIFKTGYRPIGKLAFVIISTFVAFSSQSMETASDISHELCQRGEKYFKGLPVEEKFITGSCGTCASCPTCVKPSGDQQPLENIHFQPSMAKETEGKSAEELYQLSKLYDDVDSSKALHCLALAATNGHTESKFVLGRMHYHQHMTSDHSIMALYNEPKNFYMALYFFHQAAVDGDAVAQCCLGQVYFRGGWKTGSEMPVLEKNHEKAFNYFTLAARQNWAEAQFMLGLMYKDGIHVAVDLEKAVENLSLAHKNGQQEALPILKNLSTDKRLDDEKRAGIRALFSSSATYFYEVD